MTPHDQLEPEGQRSTATGAAFRIAGTYAILALAWIFLSDRVATFLAGSVSSTERFQNIKGSFFVLATAFLLWLTIRMHFRRLETLNARIAESDERHRRLLDQAPVAIILLREGKVVYRNSRAICLVGEDTRETAPDFISRIGTDVQAQVRELLDRVLREDASAQLDEIPMLASDGRHLLVELTAACKSAAERTILLAVADVTERKRLETIVRDAQRIEAAGSIAGQVTHEFNNVLTAILGQTAIARSAVHGDPAATQALSRIETVGQHAAGLTRSLLLFQRQSPSIKKIVPVASILDGAITLISGVLPAKVRLELDINDVEGLHCFCDAAQLKQALLNLAVNARDAMPQGGVLTIFGKVGTAESMAASPPMVLTVSDTGAGMPAHVLERVFTPFFTTKPPGKGTGLGLAVTKGIVNDHEGTITVQSTPGKGSTFTITLPTVAAEVASAKPAQPPTEPAEPTRKAKPKIIIVGEDNPSVRNVVVETLRMAGYHVVACNDGTSVINTAAEHGDTVAALVLDVGLPGATGIECLARIRAENPTVPCVLTTGGARPDVPYELVERTAFLAKPFSIDDLLDTVGALVAMERDGQSVQDSR